MKAAVQFKAACIVCGLLFSSPLHAQQTSFDTLIKRIRDDVHSARALAQQGRAADAQRTLLRTYLDEYEPFESNFGPGSSAPVNLSEQVKAGEAVFHTAMRGDSAGLTANLLALEQQMQRVASAGAGLALDVAVSAPVNAHAIIAPARASTPEIRAVLTQIQQADAAFRAGHKDQALALVEHAYLEQFEPIESRLPARIVEGVEKTIHLQLRPALKRNANVQEVSALLGGVGAQLLDADHFLAKGGSFWFSAFNAFVIVVREGLEAVLLIAALLAYLTATGAQARHRRQIYGGMAAGVVASIGTWFVASTLLPISGASRELLEGITALVAVAVLLYVAHWLFQKTYIHDWKEYLRSHVGEAMTRGSALAMAALAFAAVYREGFETVLFYQALAFESGVAAILSGFIPGALLITLIGYGIIRAGMKLPLKKVFTATNAVLMYLAFVFIGKGLYNLQEAGVFAPHALPLPDHPALRQLFGFYPLIETVLGQLLFLLLLTTTYFIYRKRLRAQKEKVQPASADRTRVVA